MQKYRALIVTQKQEVRYLAKRTFPANSQSYFSPMTVTDTSALDAEQKQYLNFFDLRHPILHIRLFIFLKRQLSS